MRKMTARSTLLLAAIAALGFAFVLLLRPSDAPTPIAAGPVVIEQKPARNAIVAARDAVPSPAPTPAKTAEAPKPIDAQVMQAVGTATGAIHFEKKPAERDAKGESLDIDVHSALGVWQPDGLVMRVLLLESRPGSADVDRLLRALQSGEPNATRSAVLELRFVPTAQAYDRNELDSATLTVTDGKITSSADALSSLDWHGSLPSPQVDPAPGQRPSFTLNSSNETVSSAREIWKQSWRLSLTVPVVTRQAAAAQP